MATSDFDIETIIAQTPFFSEQWDLQNTGQTGGTFGADANIVDAWTTATGEGVVIGIFDGGVQYTHPDLNDNYNSALSYDFVDDDNDPEPPSTLLSTEDHGTLVAGIAVGDGDNEIGIIGAAPDATFASLRRPSGISFSLELEQYNALSYRNQEIDIYNNSWTFTNNFFQLPTIAKDAIEIGIQEGRGGLGNIYVFAAGNNGLEDNVNYDALTNSRYTIAVAAIDHNGEHSAYSTTGASLLISGYSSNVLAEDSNEEFVGVATTDTISLSEDTINGEYSYFSGTSAAAPLVSGVIALMLEANPNLTWRDVQHILVETAEKNDRDDLGWVQNGAGHDVNYKYGFGAIDATAAVNAAQDWETVVEEVSFTYEQTNLDLEITDNEPIGIDSSITIEEDIDLEWVEVVFDADYFYSSDLEIVLTSPDGTESILAEQHEGTERDSYSEGWVFTSARHWGESSGGEWTLTVSDNKENFSYTDDIWNSWQLNLYGSDNPPELINPLADLTVTEDYPSRTISLYNVFQDADGDEITIAVQTNSNEELVTTNINNKLLTLDFAENQSGTAEITLIATTNGQTVDDTFSVTVEPVDDLPKLINPIADLTVTENDDNQNIDLSSVFQDIDGDEITFEVQYNSNDELVSATIEDETLTLDFAENQSGITSIILRATANERYISDTFTVTVEPIDDAPIDNAPELINPITDLTVTENDDNQTIDLSSVFQDADGDEITIAVQTNSNEELVTTTIEDEALTLDFAENQSGTAEITLQATANGQNVDDTFTVTVESDEPEEPIEPEPTIDLFRFRNTTFETGTYVFVGEAEKDAILADENLSNTFSLDGEQSDGTVNPAFVASTTPGDDLIPFFRLKSLDVLGTFLFVSTGEYETIFAEDSEQQDKWEQEGLNSDGEDIPEFYLYDGSAEQGIKFNRFQNTQNGTFLYAGLEETDAIENDPNLSNLFSNQGVAFKF